MQAYQARYQAANLSDKESKDSFVVRQKEFHRVMDDIRSTQLGDSLQHYVFVGRRGSGKSTLLRRIQAEVNSTDLKENYLVVNLSEEQAGIYQLYDLWDYIIRDLQQQGFTVESPNWLDYEDDMKAYSHDLFQIIQDCMTEAGKQLIVLIDNIDRIFKTIQRGQGGDSQLLREQLMNHNLVRIIGGSTIMSEDYWKYDMPFYDFFNIKRLNPLSNPEIKELLKHWAEKKDLDDIKKLVDKHPGKLQAIRMLTDGTPRTMLLFVEMLVSRPMQNGFDYLRRIIDEATPIYQERLEQLSPQQQKVLIELSFFWESVPVEKLISVCKMHSKTLSSQLNQLVKAGLVEKVKGETKNLAYRLEERFFNLWLLMTQGGPKQKREVRYLTVFLENWYDQKELKNLYKEFVTQLDGKKLKADYAASMAKALSHSRSISVAERDELLYKVKNSDYAKTDWMQELPETSSEIYKKVDRLIENQEYGQAEDLLLQLEQDDGLKHYALGFVCRNQDKQGQAQKHYLKAIAHGNASAMNDLGVLQQDQGDQKEAEKYYLMAIDKEQVDAMNNLGILYFEQEKFEEAEKNYRMAIDKGHVMAVNNLGYLYQNQGNAKGAKKYYRMAIDKGYVKAMVNLGYLYQEQGNQQEAEKYYLMAVDQGQIDAMYNLANLYKEQGRLREAEKCYLLAMEKGQGDAMNNLGNLNKEKGNQKEAEKYYLMAIEHDNLEAMFNLGYLYHSQEKFEYAEKYYLMAIEHDHTGAMNNLAFLYYDQNRSKRKAVQLAEKIINEKLYLKEPEPLISLDTASCIFLWAGNMELFEKAKSCIEEVISDGQMYDAGVQVLSDMLTNWLIHKQYHVVFQFIEKFEQLKNVLSPLYYANLHLLEGHEKQLRNMPPELEENVNDILQHIKEKQAFYYG